MAMVSVVLIVVFFLSGHRARPGTLPACRGDVDSAAAFRWPSQSVRIGSDSSEMSTVAA
jgi:hypothetical protein